MKTFAYVSDTTSTTQNLTAPRLAEHEYWGEDFAAGKCSFGVFTNEAGKLFGVCTYGHWRDWGLESGEQVGFQHTQTGRTKVLTYRGYVDNETWTPEELAKVKMKMWTLK